MKKWLVKSEANVYSIDALLQDSVSPWEGVRNYQARNFLKEMTVGDMVLFYHSQIEPIGVAGLARVKKAAYPDASQFKKSSEYFDSKATKENPRWFCPDLEFISKFEEVIPMRALRGTPGLRGMVLFRASRLSVQPVTDKEFEIILKLAKSPLPKAA